MQFGKDGADDSSKKEAERALLRTVTNGTTTEAEWQTLYDVSGCPYPLEAFKTMTAKVMKGGSMEEVARGLQLQPQEPQEQLFQQERPERQEQQQPESPAEDPKLRFRLKDRVVCKLPGDVPWCVGTVQRLNLPNPYNNAQTFAYEVMLGPPLERKVGVPEDTSAYVRPEVCFGQGRDAATLTRVCLPPPSEKEKGSDRAKLRFAVAERVACLVEDDTGEHAIWKGGTVAELWARHSEWGDSDGPAAYAVDLDGGSGEGRGCRVLVHRDDHLLIRDLALQPAGELGPGKRFTVRRCRTGQGEAGAEGEEEEEEWEKVDHQVRKARKCLPPTPEEMEELGIDLAFPDRMRLIQLHKEEATQLFKDGDYHGAAVRYSKSLARCTWGASGDLPPEQAKKVDEVRLLLHLNMAMCCIKMEDWQECVVHCDGALKIDSASTKALYRRATAYERTRMFNLAKADLVLAAKHAPDDAAILKLGSRVDAQIKLEKAKDKNEKAKEKNMAKKMFG